MILVLAALANPHASEPTLDLSFATYDVKGESLQAVQLQMERNGHRGFPGHTGWYISWTHNCVITVEATVLLPTLSKAHGLDPEEQAEFNRFLTELRAHEMNHVNLLMESVQDFAAAGCTGPRTWQEVNDAYDEHTDHGKAEGAWLRLAVPILGRPYDS